MLSTGNVTLIDLLHVMPVAVTFRKESGDVRTMLCTTCPDYMPTREADKTTPSKDKNPDIAVVWDIEIDAWRSFRWDRVTGVSIGDVPK